MTECLDDEENEGNECFVETVDLCTDQSCTPNHHCESLLRPRERLREKLLFNRRGSPF